MALGWDFSSTPSHFQDIFTQKKLKYTVLTQFCYVSQYYIVKLFSSHEKVKIETMGFFNFTLLNLSLLSTCRIMEIFPSIVKKILFGLCRNIYFDYKKNTVKSPFLTFVTFINFLRYFPALEKEQK